MKITIRHCDDWIAVYKDGQKVWENHSCSIRDGLEALGIDFEDQDYHDKVDDYGGLKAPFGKRGSNPFPDTLQ
jgi:hypothetical protein